MDIGADRIARTAHAALEIIDQLRRMTGRKICLGWRPGDCMGISAIEVYPAATLRQYRLQSVGYKEREQVAARVSIAVKLKAHIGMLENMRVFERNADALDSAVCLLSAKDFIEGRVFMPEDMDLAKKEGWIWVNKSNKTFCKL